MPTGQVSNQEDACVSKAYIIANDEIAPVLYQALPHVKTKVLP